MATSLADILGGGRGGGFQGPIILMPRFGRYGAGDNARSYALPVMPRDEEEEEEEEEAYYRTAPAGPDPGGARRAALHEAAGYQWGSQAMTEHERRQLEAYERNVAEARSREQDRLAAEAAQEEAGKFDYMTPGEKKAIRAGQTAKLEAAKQERAKEAELQRYRHSEQAIQDMKARRAAEAEPLHRGAMEAAGRAAQRKLEASTREAMRRARAPVSRAQAARQQAVQQQLAAIPEEEEAAVDVGGGE